MWTGTRTSLGPKYSEGARRAWLALDERGWSQTRLSKELRALKVNVNTSFLLHGDRRPGRAAGEALRVLLGIDPSLWDMAPQASEEAAA